MKNVQQMIGERNGSSQSNYWFENFKGNKRYYINLCRKFGKEVGLGDFDLLQIEYYAIYFYEITDKYDELLDSCGVRLPSDVYTWFLKETIRNGFIEDFEVMDSELKIIANDYEQINENEVQQSLHFLKDYVYDQVKFKVFVENKDIFEFVQRFQKHIGVFTLTCEGDYLYTATSFSDIHKLISYILASKETEDSYVISFLATKSKSDAVFYHYYLQKKYINKELSFEIKDEIEPLDYLEI
jgi:hypothetical protein